ncbi:hypothetical protein [Nocardia seriolae]|uniref:Uncharacterized protein n=1 Tax=Nocardia seriolae TaxID=37332 RepID=A0ABC9YTK9_9NOCA|nr:hypothetical protein [Nocardia seriolae]APB00319.1 hypothetical protein NS506_06283 [Nocardia seriolae]MTJ71842.1 hypothetical protein [Nocardia seriolae]MTJ89802.1 hypothetical protein [Nocardia seriolae]MTK33778.1 hypothetical protein [Nocardia seriolae]MTK50380.1 hypothetical protein [Nocardia seriolae]
MFAALDDGAEFVGQADQDAFGGGVVQAAGHGFAQEIVEIGCYQQVFDQDGRADLGAELIGDGFDDDQEVGVDDGAAGFEDVADVDEEFVEDDSDAAGWEFAGAGAQGFGAQADLRGVVGGREVQVQQGQQGGDRVAR